MSRRRRSHRRESRGKWQETFAGKLAVFLLLLNILVWAALRDQDLLLPSASSVIISFFGMWLGQRGLRRVKRHLGDVSGESIALIGMWGNRIVFSVCLLLFAYLLAIGILQGELI